MQNCLMHSREGRRYSRTGNYLILTQFQEFVSVLKNLSKEEVPQAKQRPEQIAQCSMFRLTRRIRCLTPVETIGSWKYFNRCNATPVMVRSLVLISGWTTVSSVQWSRAGEMYKRKSERHPRFPILCGFKSAAWKGDTRTVRRSFQNQHFKMCTWIFLGAHHHILVQPIPLLSSCVIIYMFICSTLPSCKNQEYSSIVFLKLQWIEYFLEIIKLSCISLMQKKLVSFFLWLLAKQGNFIILRFGWIDLLITLTWMILLFINLFS